MAKKEKKQNKEVIESELNTLVFSTDNDNFKIEFTYPELRDMLAYGDVELTIHTDSGGWLWLELSFSLADMKKCLCAPIHDPLDGLEFLYKFGEMKNVTVVFQKHSSEPFDKLLNSFYEYDSLHEKEKN